jgi:hypothetical protein
MFVVCYFFEFATRLPHYFKNKLECLWFATFYTLSFIDYVHIFPRSPTYSPYSPYSPYSSTHPTHPTHAMTLHQRTQLTIYIHIYYAHKHTHTHTHTHCLSVLFYCLPPRVFGCWEFCEGGGLGVVVLLIFECVLTYLDSLQTVN